MDDSLSRLELSENQGQNSSKTQEQPVKLKYGIQCVESEISKLKVLHLV